MKFFLHLVLYTLLVSPLLAQSVHQEQMKDMIQKGKELVEAGRYDQANLLFRRILTYDQPIPSEFCYYFATALFHTRQFQNSKSFIKKYYEIAGQGGQFLSQVRELEKLVDEEFSMIMECQICDDSGYLLVVCNRCEGEGEVLQECGSCKGKGNFVCDLCGGGGVVVRKSIFNTNEYLTCGKCKGTGKTVCPTCEGNKQIHSICQTCKGIGGIASGNLCDHQPQHTMEQ